MAIEDLRDELKSRKSLWVLLALVLVWAVHHELNRPMSHPPGILVKEDPRQEDYTPDHPAPRPPWAFRGHRITPLADFEVRGRILSRERYRFDRAADLSPLDLALGWGRMSDTKVLARILIDQDHRWYEWTVREFPIPAEEIITHSANMHMIPATPLVERRLLALREGQVVHLKGELILAEGPDGWTWRSSLTRADSGNGACEVMWVEDVLR